MTFNKKGVMDFKLRMLKAGNGWEIIAPNGHRRECLHSSTIPQTLEELARSYAEWMVKVTNLDHLEITVEHKTVAAARRPQDSRDE